MKKDLCYLLSILLFIQNAYANLIWTTSFGQSGSGDGLFNTPYGIRIHPITGDIWVADSSNSRLQVFKNDHSFSKVFNTTGNGDTKPVDLVFESTGKMYVGDYDTGYIQVYDNSGNKVKRFYGNDNLKALGIDTYNRVYTTSSSSGGTVSRYDQYGNQEKMPREYTSSGITIGPDDYIYYVEGNYHYLLKYDNNFKSINAISLNSSSTWMNGIDHGYNGKVYITNTNDSNIIIVKDDISQELSLFKDSSNSFNSPRYIIGDKHGKFYVSDTGNNRVVVLFDPTAWTVAGTSILGTLSLTEDLTLNNGYNLKVQSIDDTTSGSVVKSDGKFILSNPAILTVNTGSSITADSFIIDGGVLSAASDVELNTNIQLSSGNNSISANDGANLTLSGIISGTVSKLKKLGTGTLSLSGTNTYSGDTNIAAGTVSTGSVSALGSGNITMSDSTTLQASADLNLSKAITIAGTSTIDTQGNQVTSSGVISGEGKLTKQGTGTLALSGANTYSGGTDIAAGTVSTGSVSALGSGNITMSDSTTLQASADLNLSKAITIAGTSTIDTQGNQVTSSGVISGEGKLTKQGTGTLALSSTNTYSGGTNIDEGLITITQDQALGSGAVNIADNTSLDFNADNNIILNNVITGSGTIEKNGNGDLALNGESIYSGNTNLNEGSISLGSSTALGSSVLTMNDNTILNLNNNINVENTIILGNSNTIGVPGSFTGILTGLISNTNSNLSKKGTGTLLLKAENNHQGITQVEEGTLHVDNVSLGGDVTVNGKLKGTGYLLSSLINNGVVTPGSSPGIIRVSEDYTQNPQGTLEIYIRPSSNPVAGVDYAQLNVTGTANIGGNLLVDGEYGDYTEGVRYNILTAAGEVNGMFDNVTLNTAGVYSIEAYYHLHDVFLQLSRNYLPHFEHLEDNRTLAIYINSLDRMSPEFIKTINPIYDMSHDGVINSLNSITPDRNLVANYISQDMTNLIHNVNSTRLDHISSMTVGNNTGEFSFNQINRGATKLLSSPTRANLIDGFTSNLNNNLLNSDKHYVWFLPFGQFVNKKSSSNRDGYDVKTVGMLLGYDYKINDSTVGGISLGHYKSSFNYTNNQGSNNKIKSVFATLYGNKQVGNGYIRGSLFSAQNDNKLNREIHIGENIHSTSSNHNSYVISPRIEMGYNIKGDYNYQITPFISTEYSMEFNKSYKEKGDSALNMRIKSGRNDLMTSELGLKLKKTIKLGDEEEVSIKAKLSYINKKRFDSKNKIRGGFIEQVSNYSSYNDSRVEHHISPSIGLEVRQDNDTIVGINYNGEISKSYSNHEVMLQIGRQF